ncbi:BPI fold-containing family A member 1-like [Equus caballus]|uniref:BPI fold-containing family A member 1 n=1 Tax=Equus caballus TaxID=9796 RepID=A0A5F5PZQ4_HORSE
MFQIGGLIVFCGLLGQTTALLETLPLSLNQTQPLTVAPSPALSHTDFAGSLSIALSNGLLSEGLLGSLEKLPLLNTLKGEGVTTKAVFGGLLGKIATVIRFMNIIDVKVTHPRLLDLDTVQSPDGGRFYVTIPLDMILNVNMLLVGSLLKGGVKLNITAELLTAQDEQKNIPLVLDSCTHSADSLKITLLNRFVPVPFQRLFKSLSKILPGLVQSKVCSLLKEVLSCSDTPIVETIFDRHDGLQTGICH